MGKGLYAAAREVGKYKPLPKNRHGLIAETFGEGFKMFRAGLNVFGRKKERRD